MGAWGGHKGGSMLKKIYRWLVYGSNLEPEPKIENLKAQRLYGLRKLGSRGIEVKVAA